MDKRHLRSRQNKDRPDRVWVSRPAGKPRLPRFLSRAILLLACVALFFPLVVSYDCYYPYVFLKSILFRLAVQAMMLLYVALAAVCSSYRPRFHRITWALIAYFGIMLFCSLPGISVGAWCSRWGDFSRMGGMFAQLHLLAYFFVLSQTFRQERDWLVLFASSLFSGILMGLTGVIQHLHLNFLYDFATLDPRIGGATGNPGFFGASMMLNFFIALWFLSRKDRREVYSYVAKVWLFLLLFMDAALIVWDASTSGLNPGVITTGLSLFPVALFVLILHGVTLGWYFARSVVHAGTVFFAILGLFFLFCMNKSETRAVLVGAAGSLAVLSILYLLGGASRKIKWMAGFLILFLLMIPPTIWLNRNSSWVQNQRILARFAAISLTDARLISWKAGILGFLDRPIFGWGPENYENAFDPHFPSRLLAYPEAGFWFDRAHNFIIEICATTGLAGLAAYSVLYALIFTFLLRRWFRTRDATNSLLVAALLLAYLFQNLFSFDTVNTDGIVFLVLAFVAYLYSEDSGKAEALVPHPARFLNLWQASLIVALAAAVLTASYWYLVMKPYDSNLLLNYAIASEKVQDRKSQAARYVFREDIRDLFQRASDYQTTGRFEVREELANYASELAQAADVPLEDRVRVAAQAAALLEESITEDPNRARRYMYPASLITKVFGLVNRSDPALARSLADKCLAWLEKAEKLCPTRPQIFIDRAQTLVSLGRVEDAIPAMRTAISLDPEIEDRHIDLLTLCVSAGRYDEAALEWQTIRKSFRVTSADYDRLIRLYYSKRQFALIVGLYKEQLEQNPDDPMLLAHLASAYKDAGDMDSARQTAIQAAALSPQVAANLKEFLQSLNTSGKGAVPKP